MERADPTTMISWSLLGMALLAGARNIGMLFVGRVFTGLGSCKESPTDPSFLLSTDI
jgi:hypothetical protein